VEFSITLSIIIVTCLVSINGFSNQKTIDDLIFYPPAINRRKQFYRFITHGFIHADVMHLAFNMMALYSFGEFLEKQVFSSPCVFGENGRIFYLVLYFLTLIVASLPDYLRYRNSFHFRSLGASGAVSGVIFATLVVFPQMPIRFFFIPINIPGFIFGFAYLAISAYLDKRGGGNINHSAHFWGAAFGIVFMLVTAQLFGNFDVYDNFMSQMKSMERLLPLMCRE
jgi:membrane associated rhomboid family serine protease